MNEVYLVYAYGGVYSCFMKKENAERYIKEELKAHDYDDAYWIAYNLEDYMYEQKEDKERRKL